MSLTKSKLVKSFQVDLELNTISITYQIIITDSIEGELARKDFNKAFVPGQTQLVKDFTNAPNSHPAIIFLNSIWTQAVIDAYNASVVN